MVGILFFITTVALWRGCNQASLNASELPYGKWNSLLFFQQEWTHNAPHQPGSQKKKKKKKLSAWNSAEILCPATFSFRVMSWCHIWRTDIWSTSCTDCSHSSAAVTLLIFIWSPIRTCGTYFSHTHTHRDCINNSSFRMLSTNYLRWQFHLPFLSVVHLLLHSLPSYGSSLFLNPIYYVVRSSSKVS